MTTQINSSVTLHSKSLTVFGATSAIAQAVAKLHAEQGYCLVLIGRNSARLEQLEQHYQTLGAEKVVTICQDLNDFDQHSVLIPKILAAIGRFDRVLFAQGTLPAQSELEQSAVDTLACIRDNGLNLVSLATLIASQLQVQQHGQIGIIGSVAGDRGRQSNYTYGAAKAMVATFAQGLRNRLQPFGVQVMTIKPGFVDTPMTAEFPKGALWAQPEDVAAAIIKGFDRRRDVIYTPWFWRYIMLIIQHIPETIFKRLKL